MAVKAITNPSGVARTLTFQEGIGQPTQTQPTQPATYRATAVITDPR
ncbi:MAG: MBG domain-containing protein [Holophaga sp.]|jgi:hypothetical protein